MPLSAYCDDFMDTLTAQIIDLHPDVLIMTGDNTNNGKTTEMNGLYPYLQQLTDAGIALIMTTGNHDMHGSAEEYRRIFFPLLDPDETDTETLSYAKVINGVRFLAMDDSSALHGNGGHLPAKTVSWLKKQLDKAEKNGETVIFLSHYSVLTGLQEDGLSSYRIDHPRLPSLLQKGNVRLCFSGHQHSQNILHDQDLYEVISASVLILPCLYDILDIGEKSIRYHTETVSFDRYAPDGFADAVRDIELDAVASRHALFDSILAEKIPDLRQRQDALALLDLFFDAYGQGKFAEYYEEITADPSLEVLLDALSETNYGPWMRSLLSEKPADASYLLIGSP